jgi:phage terminase small subunit
VLTQRQLDHNNSLHHYCKAKHGHVFSPYVRIIDRCIILMRAVQQEMGFTPSARARIIMGDAANEPADEWAGSISFAY